ncbi:MAG TPA: hypothetical protein VM260_08735 [Pirellula sp.]|nr:hypothetical protein [Pirellula sp.]
MNHTSKSGMILGLLLICSGGFLYASEADEFRQRAKALRKEASELAERGNKEQAMRLEIESVELLAAAERLEMKTKPIGDEGRHAGIEKEVRHHREMLNDLLAKQQKLKAAKAREGELAEVNEQIVGRRRELQAIQSAVAKRGEHSPEFQVQVEKLEVAARRIHHIRVAAENLKMADLHDLAVQLMEKAASMERDVQDAKKRLAVDMQNQKGSEDRPDEQQEMRSEIARLRAEVKELREIAERRK